MSALLSSLLTEVTHSQSHSPTQSHTHSSDSTRLLTRLLVSDWQDSVEHIAPLVISLLTHSEPSEKLQGWRMLPVLLRSHYRTHSFIIKPLCQFIDKQSFVHSLNSSRGVSSVVVDAVSEGVSSIFALALDVSEVSSSVDGQLVKIITTLLDMMKDHTSGKTTTLLAMYVMSSVVTAKGRLFTPQHLNRVISTSFVLLSDGHLSGAAAELIAISVSYASTELYESVWKCLSNECTRLLQILGLGSTGFDKSRDVILGLRFSVDVESPTSALVGIQKAMYIEVCYRGVCATLAQMARVGTCTGPVSQEFRSDVATSLNIAICHRSAMSSKEAKFTMENRASISPAHVSVVWPQLTLHALSLLAVLVSTVGTSPFLYHFASVACSCVTSSLTHVFPNNKKADAVTVAVTVACSDTLTACALKALECLQYLLRSFPTLVVSKCEQLLLKFVDIISLQVQYLTSDPQQQDVDTSNTFISNKDVITASFEVCETLLITSSPLLPVAVRQQLEGSVLRGLQCLVKGVVLHSFLSLNQGGNALTSQRLLHHVQQNKKVRRELCEVLRCDVDVQKYFLLLACAEGQTSYVDGSRSANLPLLSSAAAVCSGHQVTAAVCGRIGLCTSNIMFPAGVGLPSPPLIEVAHKKILEHNAYIEQSKGKTSKASGDNDIESEEEDAGDNTTSDELVNVTQESSKKRKMMDSDDAEDISVQEAPMKKMQQETEEKSVPKVAKVDWLQSTKRSATTKIDTTNIPTKLNDDDSSGDDDDELPDIDIDADIDA